MRVAAAARPDVEADFFAREAAVPDEDLVGLFEEAPERELDAFDRELDAFARELDPLVFLRAVADLRDDAREDFEDVFFFDAPRAAADFRPVFLARLELFDLLAALPAAFFFFFAT